MSALCKTNVSEPKKGVVVKKNKVSEIRTLRYEAYIERYAYIKVKLHLNSRVDKNYD